MSGHIFFSDNYFGYDDAIYVALRLAELISKSDKTLSELTKEIPKYYSTPELRLDCKDDDQKEQIMLEVFNYFSSNVKYHLKSDMFPNHIFSPKDISNYIHQF